MKTDLITGVALIALGVVLMVLETQFTGSKLTVVQGLTFLTLALGGWHVGKWLAVRYPWPW